MLLLLLLRVAMTVVAICYLKMILQVDFGMNIPFPTRQLLELIQGYIVIF